MTVVGHAPNPDDFVTRSGARPGDALVVTGELGGAAAGLLLLEDPGSAFVSSRPGQTDSDARWWSPGSWSRGRGSPRDGRWRRPGARAMIDLSDGLGGDAGHLAEASGAGLRIEAAALPIAAGVAEVAAAAGRDALELAASGGEDYELLAALPADRFDAAAEAVEQTGEAR